MGAQASGTLPVCLLGLSSPHTESQVMVRTEDEWSPARLVSTAEPVAVLAGGWA